MSFSGEIKEELSAVTDSRRHCRLAELAAIISGSGQILIDEDDELILDVCTENKSLARKYYLLLKDLFELQAVVTLRKNEHMTRDKTYHLTLEDQEDVLQVLTAVNVVDEKGAIVEEVEKQQRKLIYRSCCKRAYIRGAFMAAGSISDPEKSYHMEIVCVTEERARALRDLLREMGMDARIVTRKKNRVVYLKEGDQILHFLGMIGANKQLFAMENVRIVKEMRNNVNRRVNCETANINKTVSASVRQIEDILYIEKNNGFPSLPDNLREMAEIRLEYRDLSLKDLGEKLDPPVGKSGVNHRLRKLSEIARRMRQSRPDQD